jgi:hypothetical protein
VCRPPLWDIGAKDPVHSEVRDTSTRASKAARCGSFMGRHLTFWLLALVEHEGHDDLRGSDRLSVISYVHRRTELYYTQTCLA